MKYDVIVVGAGPAGATAAKYLAEQKVKVLLLDKSRFPRDKPCGGALPMRLVKRFPYINESDIIDAYSYGGSIYYATFDQPITVLSDEPMMAMVLRKKFDHGLVKIAVKHGATLLEGKTVTDVTIEKEKVTVILDDGSKVETEIVIGADGVWSTIAKKTGLSHNHHQIDICIYEENPKNNNRTTKFFDDRNLFHIIFGFEQIEGYGWVFPKKSHINIGIGEFAYKMIQTKPRKNLRELYTQYSTSLKKNNILPGDLKIGKLKGAALPFQPLEKIYTDRVLLVGDAAGFVNPISGAGLYYAMSSGMIAANVAVQALKVGDTSARFLSKYDDIIWKHDFGKELKFMIRTYKRWGDKMEQFFNVAASDKQLSELCIKVATGQIDNKKVKGKLSRRFIYAYLKTRFRRGRK
jgi:geranylgeranyl reductase family protein